MTGHELPGASQSGVLACGAPGAPIADDMTLCFIDDLFTQECSACGTAYKRSAWGFLFADAGDRCPYCHARPGENGVRAAILS